MTAQASFWGCKSRTGDFVLSVQADHTLGGVLEACTEHSGESVARMESRDRCRRRKKRPLWHLDESQLFYYLNSSDIEYTAASTLRISQSRYVDYSRQHSDPLACPTTSSMSTRSVAIRNRNRWASTCNSESTARVQIYVIFS